MILKVTVAGLEFAELELEALEDAPATAEAGKGLAKQDPGVSRSFSNVSELPDEPSSRFESMLSPNAWPPPNAKQSFLARMKRLFFLVHRYTLNLGRSVKINVSPLPKYVAALFEDGLACAL
jgi:hypothetical protein